MCINQVRFLNEIIVVSFSAFGVFLQKVRTGKIPAISIADHSDAVLTCPDKCIFRTDYRPQHLSSY
jgi:hypothetical protein